MSKKKSYMDKDNILSEGFFKALIGILLKPKITSILKSIQDDPELAKLTKDAHKAVQKANRALDKSNAAGAKRLKAKGMEPLSKWKKW